MKSAFDLNQHSDLKRYTEIPDVVSGYLNSAAEGYKADSVVAWVFFVILDRIPAGEMFPLERAKYLVAFARSMQLHSLQLPGGKVISEL